MGLSCCPEGWLGAHSAPLSASQKKPSLEAGPAGGQGVADPRCWGQFGAGHISSPCSLSMKSGAKFQPPSAAPAQSVAGNLKRNAPRPGEWWERGGRGKEGTGPTQQPPSVPCLPTLPAFSQPPLLPPPPFASALQASPGPHQVSGPAWGHVPCLNVHGRGSHWGGFCPSSRHLAMTGDIFGGDNSGRGCYWHLVVDPRMLLILLQGPRQPPNTHTQGTVQPQQC